MRTHLEQDSHCATCMTCVDLNQLLLLALSARSFWATVTEIALLALKHRNTFIMLFLIDIWWHDILTLKELLGFKVGDWGWSFQALLIIWHSLLSNLVQHAITAQRYEVTNKAGTFPWQVEMMKEQPSDHGNDSTPKTKSNPRKAGTCFDSQFQGSLWLWQTSVLYTWYRCMVCTDVFFSFSVICY